MLQKLPFLFTGTLMLFMVKSIAQPVPSKRQLDWQKLETIAFIHFGSSNLKTFDPYNFNAETVIATLKQAGFKQIIITAKHNSGFCLWPSKYTDFSVKNTSWKGGKGDFMKELALACNKLNVKLGVYLSPWDKNEASYGSDDYNIFYKNQLSELLTEYGPVSEVWFDGNKGKDAKDMIYDFQGYWKLVRRLQPNAVIFSDIGPDVRWVGNESGSGNETSWSLIDTAGMKPGSSDRRYLNTGDPYGKLWIPAEADVSIRDGWFYNPKHNVKSGRELVEIYYNTVGRNCVLLLNVPLDKSGVIDKVDIRSLRDYRTILNETFNLNLIKKNINTVLVDTKIESYITLKEGNYVVFNFKRPIVFDRILLQENITKGQNAEKGSIEYLKNGNWLPLAAFTTIGYKRLLRHPVVSTSSIRLKVSKAKADVQLGEIGLYKASNKELL